MDLLREKAVPFFPAKEELILFDCSALESERRDFFFFGVCVFMCMCV